ncbi:MAG: peptidylprolyl isomerase, partial [Gemmatimonadetes bacterium]|nr:peptidylprolyl isomerase [Gemmatimonadota bacterium]
RTRSVPNASPVINEADNGLRNVRGTIAMARSADPHSATSQFFINVLDNSGYDFKEKTVSGWGYAVFGHVTEGLDVLDAITAVPTRIQGTFPSPIDPIVIERAYVSEERGN